MLSGFDSSLDSRLREAEEAEKELMRLTPVAEEAPKLRLEKAKVQKRQERESAKSSAMRVVERSMQSATQKQTRVPELLESAGKAVQALYTLIKELEAHKKEATDSMGIVDRVDYEEELETGEEEQTELGRDPQGLEYLIASRHGQSRIKQLIDEIDPDFAFLQNCDLDEPLKRDTANFVLGHVISPERVNQERASATEAISQDRNIPPDVEDSNLAPKGFSG